MNKSKHKTRASSRHHSVQLHLHILFTCQVHTNVKWNVDKMKSILSEAQIPSHQAKNKLT